VKDGNHLEDIYGKDGTPLLRAMRLYHYDDQIVMALLNAGAETQVVSYWGTTPLGMALRMNAKKIVSKILSKMLSNSLREVEFKDGGDDSTPLIEAVEFKEGDDESTPLIEAVLRTDRKNKNVMKLLDMNADPQNPNIYGETALGIAIRQGNGDIVRKILDGPLKNIEFKEGSENSTPLTEIAARFPLDNSFAKNLLKRGANCLATNADGDTALHMAAHWGDFSLVSRMLKNETVRRSIINHPPTNNLNLTPVQNLKIMGTISNDSRKVELNRIIKLLHGDPIPLTDDVDG
jgi:ankyrin repeat protein